MTLMRSLFLPVLLLLPGTLAAQEAPEQAKVDEAIRKGADWLLKRFEKGFDSNSWNSPIELAVLTLSHANVPPDNAVLQAGIKEMTGCKLQHTYRVATHAMALQRINPNEHLDRLVHCAQWIVDTQLQNGEWGYPGTLHEMNEVPKGIDVEAPKNDGKPSGSGSTKSGIKIVRKRQPDKIKGDISNSQFALLGLRSCAEAGVEIPMATWKAAETYFAKIQEANGGWGYHFNGQKDKTTYGSMTCAGITALAICDFYQKRKPLQDQRVLKGLQWLTNNWSVSENPNADRSNVVDPQVWHFYYLYSIERTARIVQLEKLGKTDWYAEGAKWILEKQKSDGSWKTGLHTQWGQAGDLEVSDTCFAILFLAKATAPMVATGGSKKEEKK